MSDDQTTPPQDGKDDAGKKVVSIRGRRRGPVPNFSHDDTPAAPPEPSAEGAPAEPSAEGGSEGKTPLEMVREMIAPHQDMLDREHNQDAIMARLDKQAADPVETRSLALMKAFQAGETRSSILGRIQNDPEFAREYLHGDQENSSEATSQQAPQGEPESGASRPADSGTQGAGSQSEPRLRAGRSGAQSLGESPDDILKRAAEECLRIDQGLGADPDPAEAMIADVKKRVILRTAREAAQRVADLNSRDEIIEREMKAYSHHGKGGSASFLATLAQGLLGGRSTTRAAAEEMKSVIDRRRQVIEGMDIERRWLLTAADRVLEKRRDAHASFTGAADILTEAGRAFGDTPEGRELASAMAVAAQQSGTPLDQLARQVAGNEPAKGANRSVVEQLRTQYSEAMERGGDDVTEARNASSLARQQVERGRDAINDALDGLEMLAQNAGDLEDIDRKKLAEWFGDTTKPLDGAMDVTDPTAVASEREKLKAQALERVQAIFEMIDRVMRAIVSRFSGRHQGVEAAAADEVGAEPEPSF